MPNGVAEVLQKCFRRDPAERWASLAEAAEALQHAYREVVGKDFPWPTPSASCPTQRTADAHDRHTKGGVHWDDPREWLIKAFQAGGRDPAQVEAFLTRRAGSLMAQAIADLAAYEEAHRIYERLVAEGRRELEADLATLCFEKAFVHKHTRDIPGAIALYDRTIAIRERLIEQEGRRELADALAKAYGNKALAVRHGRLSGCRQPPGSQYRPIRTPSRARGTVRSGEGPCREFREHGQHTKCLGGSSCRRVPLRPGHHHLRATWWSRRAGGSWRVPWPRLGWPRPPSCMSWVTITPL